MTAPRQEDPLADAFVYMRKYLVMIFVMVAVVFAMEKFEWWDDFERLIPFWPKHPATERSSPNFVPATARDAE